MRSLICPSLVLVIASCQGGLSRDHAAAVQTEALYAPADSSAAAPDRDDPWQRAGELLFFAEALSRSGELACASCHDPSTAFQDGYERALAGTLVLKRNTPTLLNIDRYRRFFWDGRAGSLHEQVKGPLYSRLEMNSEPALLERFVTAEPELYAIYTQQDLAASIEEFVIHALVRYMRSRVTRATRYTLAVEGRARLSASEARGLALFTGRAGCARCHALPDFTDNDFHDNGLHRRKIVLESYIERGQSRHRLGTDRGRGDVVSGRQSLYTFRTPSLFNVALTAPYMHDGSLPTLEAVVDFYDRGGDLHHPSRQRLELSPRDKRDLIAFLTTLTDVRYQ